MLSFKSFFSKPNTAVKHKEQGFPQDKYFISLDTGTEVLKGLLFSVSELGVDVLRTFALPQQMHAMRSGAIMNIETVINNSRLVINKLTEGIPSEDMPKKLVLGMAGELINGISIAVDYEREQPETKEISPDEEQMIKDAVYNEIVQKGKQELAQRLHTEVDEVAILHVSITGLQINGALVDSLAGYTGRTVNLFLYASFAPKQYIQEISKIATAMDMEVATIVTQPFAVARAFKSARDRDFSAIFVDIGGGTTDIALVSQGSNIDTQMFAFGGRAFTKRIANAMNIDYRYAETRKLKYSAGELPGDVKDEIRRILATDAKLWVDAFKLGLEEIEDVTQYPTQILMCGGGSLLPDIKMALIEYPWTKELSFSEFPKIKIITPDSLDKVYDKTGQLVNPYDVTPAALARFYWDTVANPNLHYLHNSE